MQLFCNLTLVFIWAKTSYSFPVVSFWYLKLRIYALLFISISTINVNVFVEHDLENYLIWAGAPGYITSTFVNGMSFVEGWEQNFFISKWSMHQLVCVQFKLHACFKFILLSCWICVFLLDTCYSLSLFLGFSSILPNLFPPAFSIPCDNTIWSFRTRVSVTLWSYITWCPSIKTFDRCNVCMVIE